MAYNLGIFDCKGITLGANETAPGYPFVRLFSPTDFDFSFENMRVRIRDTSTFWQGVDYLGLFAGQLKAFLTAYIETASKVGKAYVPADKDWWINTLQNNYPGKFETDNLEVYLTTLFNLQGEGQVKASIYKPFNYVPEKPSISGALSEVTGVDYTKIILSGAAIVAVYAFASGGYKHLLGRNRK